MMIAGRTAKVLLIDSNVYFSKRLVDALKREGFEVVVAKEAAFALTTLEYDMPAGGVVRNQLCGRWALWKSQGLFTWIPKNATLPDDCDRRRKSARADGILSGGMRRLHRPASPARGDCGACEADHESKAEGFSANADAGAIGH